MQLISNHRIKSNKLNTVNKIINHLKINRILLIYKFIADIKRSYKIDN